MRSLIIDQSTSTPSVVLDPDNGILRISGESRPSDVRELYDQIIIWMEEFSAHLQSSSGKTEPVVFSFDFDYFNSSSGKYILDICKVIAKLRLQNIDINVHWHFEKDDIDMLETGKEMSKIVRFPFEYIQN
jgi:hypothetical protein